MIFFCGIIKAETPVKTSRFYGTFSNVLEDQIMGQQTYRVVFQGETIPSADIELVKRNVAALFRVDVSRVEHLFSGKKFVLKESMEPGTVRKYAEQFQKTTGARCVITGPGVNTGTTGKQRSRPEQAAPAPFYETRYRVIFKGETAPGKSINEVRTNLGTFYRVAPERLQHLFTGKRITLKDASDFWTAADFLKRFTGFGAVCHVEPVNPPENKTESPAEPPGPVVEKQSEEERIKSLSGKLYEDLTAVYKQVRQEYRVEQKNKEFQRNDNVMGCLFLLSIVAAIILVIATPLKWYMGLLGAVGCTLVLSPFMKTWDTRYVDVFLWRMEGEKRKNFPLFAATLKKWVDELPAADRAKIYLSTMADKIIAEKGNSEKREKYFRIIYPAKITAKMGIPGSKPGRPAPQPRNLTISCPKCGSNQVTTGFRGFNWKKGIAVSLFLGPLAGAVLGSSRENAPAYICQKCGKKWPK